RSTQWTEHALQPKEPCMNRDILAGKWTEMKGKVKEQWGKITDDELDRAEGKADQMVGLLQQRYGYTREKAQEEYDRFLQNADTTRCPGGWTRRGRRLRAPLP